jgi:hypothetical protein
MQMLKKLFSSDKKYYLELDEIKDSEIVQSAVKTAEKAVDVVKDKVADVANSQPVQDAVKTATEVADVAQDKLASVVTTETNQTPIKANSKQNNKTKAKANTKATKAKQNGKVAPASATKSNEKKTQPSLKDSGASSFDPPFWVAAMYNNNGSGTNSDGQMAEQTFATDNLMPTVTKYRRRPGGSLSKFRDMAKQAKTPRS